MDHDRGAAWPALVSLKGVTKFMERAWSDLETRSWCNRKELPLLQTEESLQGNAHDAHRSRTRQAPAPHLVWQAPSSAPTEEA